MSNNALPLDLFKANLELQLHIARLLQESGQRWLAAASSSGRENLAEAGAGIEVLFKTQDWQALSALSSQAFLRQFQRRMESTQVASRFALGEQAAFAEGLQRAVQDWQKAVAETVGQASAVPQSFRDMFGPWGAVWASASASGGKSAGGGAGRGK